LLVGYYFGHSYHVISAYLDALALITVSLAACAGIVFFLYGAGWTTRG